MKLRHPAVLPINFNRAPHAAVGTVLSASPPNRFIQNSLRNCPCLQAGSLTIVSLTLVQALFVDRRLVPPRPQYWSHHQQNIWKHHHLQELVEESSNLLESPWSLKTFLISSMCVDALLLHESPLVKTVYLIEDHPSQRGTEANKNPIILNLLRVEA